MEPASAALFATIVGAVVVLARVIESLVSKKKNGGDSETKVSLAEQKMQLNYIQQSVRDVQGAQEQLITKVVELTGAQTRLCDKIGDLVDSVNELIKKAA